MPEKINLFKHYRKLVFFLFNRYKGDNYKIMREYFAHILISDVEEFIALNNKKILDVGGASGEFCRILAKKRRCDAINLDPKPGKNPWKNTIIGKANKIPFDNNQFDLVICRGVLEHIPTEKQEPSIKEMFRVTKKSGFCYIVIPPWFNFHAGHGSRPFHIFPFKIAKFLRELFFKNKIIGNSFEDNNLYKITCRRMERMIKNNGFKIVATRDTHFRLHFFTKIPFFQEFTVPAVAFILKK